MESRVIASPGGRFGRAHRSGGSDCGQARSATSQRSQIVLRGIVGPHRRRKRAGPISDTCLRSDHGGTVQGWSVALRHPNHRHAATARKRGKSPRSWRVRYDRSQARRTSRTDRSHARCTTTSELAWTFRPLSRACRPHLRCSETNRLPQLGRVSRRAVIALPN